MHLNIQLLEELNKSVVSSWSYHSGWDIKLIPHTESDFISFKCLEQWRARPDYFKTFVENLVQEIFEQVDGVLAA